MSKFDSNPFDDDTSNPYSSSAGSGAPRAPAAPGTASTGSFFDSAANGGSSSRAPLSRGAGDEGHALPSLRMAPLPPESRSGSPFDAARDIPFSPKSLKKRQRELQEREAALRRKERELASREENLGVSKPNWPPFLPIIRHDISADIPEYLQGIQRAAFCTWLGVIISLTFNFIAVLLAWIVGAVSFVWGMSSFFLALIVVLLGVPLSYLFWYRRLYNSLKNDSSFGLVLFFVSYTSHILWFTLFTIAPPIFFGGSFMCGVLTTIGMFGSSIFIGILYAIGTVMFGCEVFLSVYVIGQVFAYFRGTGKATQLKQEAAMAALRNAV